ncbi:unnamed protein product [Cylindrotheca closterium]|uniref:Enoyl reductase (ER) domain-containing protein n=1 Tax=Cylindrotheca closterium TaxID=2856 RepID=A0AAD2FYV2_9STRA|nr:unnamed protein product [Cylindrotheca closterium]
MKAAVATGIEDVDNHIHVKEDWPKPTLATAIDSKTGKLVSELKDAHLIVRVLACAIAPGDCRLFRGKTDMAQLPKYGRPYVLGSDICGIVMEVDDKNSYFQVGDKIIARFAEPQPVGMCAEYSCVKTEFSEKCPSSIPAIHACTLPSSAAAAKNVAEGFVSKGDRVLLLGASGGVGTFLSQYIKLQGASFLAATTTQAKLAESLGVDRIIDYRTENWWELESEFQGKPFDKVIDLVNGENWTRGARSGTKVLPKKVPYVQLIPGVGTEINMTGLGIGSFLGSMLGRKLVSKCHPSCPKWEIPQGLDLPPGHLKKVLGDVESGKVRVILDSAGPFQFTSAGVRAAMRLQQSKHAHGKVVIEIAKDE